MDNNKIITPGEIHAALKAVTTPADIDHHYSDLYVRVTPATCEVMKKFQYSNMVTTFIDNIDHVLWYDIPFCYNPTLDKEA